MVVGSRFTRVHGLWGWGVCLTGSMAYVVEDSV